MTEEFFGHLKVYPKIIKDCSLKNLGYYLQMISFNTSTCWIISKAKTLKKANKKINKSKNNSTFNGYKGSKYSKKISLSAWATTILQETSTCITKLLMKGLNTSAITPI